MTSNTLTHIAPGLGESIQVMTDRVTVRLQGESSYGPFALVEVSTPPQGGPPALHRHADQEVFRVLQGTFRFDTIADGQPASVEATAGSVVLIPSMVWHNYRNIGDTPGTLLVVLQPGDMISFFRELGTPAAGAGSTPRPPGPPDRSRVVAIAEKHHVELMER
jgi:mannose-6-phosphate isomerase-like protein (cupin superfamily)